MPLFIPDEELERLASDAAASMVAAEYQDLSSLDSICAKLLSGYVDHLAAELAQSQAQNQLHLARAEFARSQAMCISLSEENAKLRSDFDDNLAELAQSHQAEKRQLMDLLEQRDAEISEKNSSIKTIKSSLDKIVRGWRLRGLKGRLTKSIYHHVFIQIATILSKETVIAARMLKILAGKIKTNATPIVLPKNL